jgi:hypothetical protein
MLQTLVEDRNLEEGTDNEQRKFEHLYAAFCPVMAALDGFCLSI